MQLKKTYIIISLLLTTQSPCLWATNGYLAHGFGTKSKALAGAGVALPLEGLSAGTNPALMVGVGNRFEMGLSIFSPRRSYTADDNGSSVPPPLGPATITPGTYDSDKEYFPIPYITYNKLLNEYSSIGVAISGNGGMNTEYPTTVFAPFNNPYGQASSPTGVDLAQIFMGIPYAYKINAQHTIGIMPIVAVQWFKAYGLAPFSPFSNAPESLTNNGYDYSYGGGLRVGWFGELTEQFSVGASYQSRLYMSAFDDYKGLFAEQGDFDTPPTFTIGTAFKATPELTFLLDWQRIEFSDVAAISNASDLTFTFGDTLLGTDNGLGFGWKDTDVIKFGVQWEYNEDWTLRAGYSHATSVIPSTQALFNILAPATISQHITFGFSHLLDKQNELNLSFMYAPEKTINGTNPNTGTQTGSIQLQEYELELGWSLRF
ncbi:OmpP1/FadL family transporter [Beggiatoa leptomitoformis]|uniref:Transporter n=1 Tax=Beggiatoa leptomitoformis TaxID=288004 RepID=A0A2N9YAP6_9GAMM|nr:outer membrane protein transport protein [Beggiatoa leptomitoformis]ALG67094.1 transporter [Beggiatoa leptomitoformis]AUI67514.1 transporter [Beggiatoa leptomitoformis]